MGAGDGHQPGRPRRRRRAGPRELRPRGPGPAGLRPGRRRAADRLLRRLRGLAVRPRRAGAGRGAPDGRRGRGAAQAARRADDRPGQPRQPGAAGRGHPGAPRRRPRRARCSPASSRPPTAGLAEELPVPAPPVTDTSYDAARALFARRGDRLPGRRVGHRRRRAGGGARRRRDWASRVVLKATGRLHKSEGGGVVLGLARPGRGAGGVRRPGRAARPAGRLRGGDGRPRRRGRADRGLRARPEVRPGRHGRPRRHPHRGARRTPRAPSRRSRSDAARGSCCPCGAPRCSSARGGARRSTWTRWPTWSPGSRASRPRTPSWSSWSSTRCSPVPTASLALDARVVLG